MTSFFLRLSSWSLLPLLLLLPSLLEAQSPFSDTFQKVAAAANAITPTGNAAGNEARSLVDCRDSFLYGIDDLFVAFERCAADIQIATKPYCLHKCAYKSLGLIDSAGKPSEADLEELAEKVYRMQTAASRRSQKNFVDDFFHCYHSDPPEWESSKGSKCFGVRKFVRCLKDRNSAACTSRNVDQEFKPHSRTDESEEGDED